MKDRAPKPLSAARLAALTAHYFERFGVPSAAHLRRVLTRRVREAQAAGQDPAEARALIESELERLRGLRVLDDARTASELANRLQRRGSSAAKIRQKLAFEGLERETGPAMANRSEDEDPELESAMTWARKRRVGPFRQGPADPELERKEAARMGRAGFGWGVVRKVLGARLEPE